MVTRSRVQLHLVGGVLGALAVVGLLCGAMSVAAHPADEILEQDMVHLRPDGITVDLTISAGTIKLLLVWTDVDRNRDKRVDAAEMDAYGQFLATGYTVTIDGKSVPISYQPGSVRMKTAYQDFELQGADPTGAMVNATFTIPFTAGDARHEITMLVNHYNGLSNDRPPELYPDASGGITATVQGNNDVDLRVTTAPAGVAAPSTIVAPRRTPTTARISGLQRFVRDPAGGPLFIALGILIAVALGALHALTPGHGKTLMAAYLVGTRGTIARAVTLGSVITLTHTGSVIALGVATVVLAGTVVPERVILWTELASGIAIVLLGVALLRARLRVAHTASTVVRRRAARPALALAAASGGDMTPSSDAPALHWHEHEDGTVHAHGWFGDHTHTHTLPRDLSWRSLVLMGVSGGLIPCPDALAILLVAMAAGHILLGIVIVLGFSVGLAAVLMALGILLTTTRLLDRATRRWQWTERATPWLPAISAAVIVLLGVIACARAAPAILG
jgi:ABC-type nickel/cobalt efflux system permease component RcnA